jgi:hypothetical protein
LLGSLLVAAAGPRPAPATQAVPHFALPLPPPLPTDPPTDLAAPMPDANLRLPAGLAQGPGAFALRVYPMPEFGTGEGYIPGSSYQSPEQRKPVQTPGFIVTVPLQ